MSSIRNNLASASRARPCARTRRRAACRGGFTLIEVLATLVLLGIILPIAMRGTSLALAAASNARHAAEATSLASTKLNELVTTDQSQGIVPSGSGDFGAEHPGYQWTCQSISRDYGLTEVTVQVKWTERGQERSVNVTTLMYDSGAAAAASTTQ